MRDKKPAAGAAAIAPLSVPLEQCTATRQSFREPYHTHICTAPADGRCPEDGHVCDCGDWWHDCP